MNNIIIRTVEESDISEMASVRQCVWNTTYRGIYSDDSIDNFDYERVESKFREHLHDKNSIFKVAIYNNKIIGYVSFGYTKDKYKDYNYAINYIHILKDYQGMGLGKTFFKIIMDYAKENNIDKFYVICNKYNYNAHKYYEKMGGTKDYEDSDLGNREDEHVIYVFEVGVLMINRNKAKEAFEKYVSDYDINNKKINIKYYHTYRVAELCESIASSINLDEEEISLAWLIGLLHDIGRFEQVMKYDTFNDIKTIDHGKFGVSILFDKKYIRNFIETDEYDNIIEKAVFAHNKASIPESYNETETLYSKIVRDADKIDILYLMANNMVPLNIINEDITDEVMRCILNKETIDRKIVATSLDNVIVSLGFVYDLNFPYSFKILKEKAYINDFVNLLNLKTDNAKEKIKCIEEDINKYLNNRGSEKNAR